MKLRNVHLSLGLILSRGIPQRTLPELYAQAVRQGMHAMTLSDAALTDWARSCVHARGQTLRKPPTWPDKETLTELARQLKERGIDILWRGARDFPSRLHRDLPEPEIPYVFVEGNRARLAERQCAIVGSRNLPDFLHAPAFNLARALSARGIVVTSGLAKGADQAAHAGAMEGIAGTVALPPMGILRLEAGIVEHIRAGEMTLLGLGAPLDRFTSALAIRRDHAIAALADDVILIASGLAGGSAYAVNHGLKLGRRIWCLEAGAATPKGNASLLNSGRARPLAISRSDDDLAEEIREAVHDPKCRKQMPPESQMDWIGSSGMLPAEG